MAEHDSFPDCSCAWMHSHHLYLHGFMDLVTIRTVARDLWRLPNRALGSRFLSLVDPVVFNTQCPFSSSVATEEWASWDGPATYSSPANTGPQPWPLGWSSNTFSTSNTPGSLLWPVTSPYNSSASSTSSLPLTLKLRPPRLMLLPR